MLDAGDALHCPMCSSVARDAAALDVLVLDLILWRETGSSAAITAALELNPGLAALGPVLPAGVWVQIPETPAPRRHDLIRLWSAP